MLCYFISDLHLDPKHEKTVAVFHNFMTQLCDEKPNALFILGDFFEYWIGDDALNEWSRSIQSRIVELSSSGTRVYFMAGNRDFLLGETFCKNAGMCLLKEPTLLQLGNQPVLLMHGDTLCSHDVQYQKFRQQVRSMEWQQEFLQRPISERIAIAKQYREMSAKHTGNLKEDIMDVHPYMIEKTFQEYGIEKIIHGHTHRPDRHPIHSPYLSNKENCERIVLGDWHDKPSFLRVENNQFFLETGR